MHKSLDRLTALFAILIAGCTVASAQLPPPPAPSQPVQAAGLKGMIEFDFTDHDFGNIWDHAKVSQDYTFRNVGTEDLTILNVKATCGCTVPELTKKVYAPGESGTITVVFDPKNRHNAQRKSVHVTTDSARTSKVTLSFKAFVSKVLDIQPSIANLGRIYKGEEKSINVFVIGSTPDFKAWPADVQPEGSPFTIELLEDAPAPANAGENGWSVFRVTMDEGLAVGRHNGALTIQTNDSRRAEVQLRGVVTIVGDLQARPPRFALGRLQPSESFESKVTLINRVAKEFGITKLEIAGEAANQGIQASFAPASEGKRDAYELVVTGIAPEDGERVLGRVIVHTDMADEPTFELPVYGFVSKPRARPTSSIQGSGGG